MIKRTLLLVILIIITLLLNGCYDSNEVDDNTYVIAIGLDKGTVTPLKLTLQYALANAMPSGGGGSGNSGTNGNVASITLDCSSIITGMDLANTIIAKRINVSHAVLMVISRELAKDGIHNYMYSIARNRQFRPTIYLAVSRCSAQDFINSIIPIQESDPSKYYQLLFMSNQYTSFSSDIKYFNFYSKMESTAIQAVTALVSINKNKNTSDLDNLNSDFKKKGHIIPYEGDFKAGNIPRLGDIKGELMGLAVFSGDKYVGELDGEDSMEYLMIEGEFKEAKIVFPDPKIPKELVVLTVKQSRPPSSSVSLKGDSPHIKVNINLEADISVIQSGYNYENTKNLNILENAVNNCIKKDMTQLLMLTAKKYKADIFGFGKRAREQFLTIDSWNAYHWSNAYTKSTFDVNVMVKIRRSGLMIRTSQPKD